jgi:hypothetical protein
MEQVQCGTLEHCSGCPLGWICRTYDEFVEEGKLPPMEMPID